MVVGFFVIIGICALVWLIFKFGDLPTFVTKFDSFQVYVQFPTAPGIQRDTPVNFCGYQIGRVTEVMAPEIRGDLQTGLEYYQTVVILSVDNKYSTIPCNVKVKLMRRGLGSSYIEIEQCPEIPPIPIDPNRPETIYLYDSVLLQGSTGVTSEFFPAESKQKLDELIDGVNKLVLNANDIIGDNSNKENIKQILTNLNVATEQVQQTLEEIQKFTATGAETLKHADSKIEEVVTALVDTSEDIRKLTTTGTATLESIDEKAERLITAMVATSEQLGGAMGEIQLVLEKVNNGQGSAGRLLNDGRFYENLLENTEQLQKVMEEMKTFIEEWSNKEIKVTIF